jgi:deoxyribose-phosphate aldolase
MSDLSQLTEAVIQRVLERLKARETGYQPPGHPGPAESRGEESLSVVCSGAVCTVVRAMVDGGASRVACALGTREIESDLAGYIDHTNLRPEATAEDIRALCEEAVRYGFASVCVHPYWVPLAVDLLRGCKVPVCTVVGFPLGANTTRTKQFETDQAVDQGASEVDMVMNIGELKGKNLTAVEKDIRGVVRAVGGKTAKVIIETALLTDEEKVTACAVAREAGADFVKTSTGFASAGATVADVQLMRRVVGPEVKIKAAGGIRDEAAARALISAGADRLGASASVKIVGRGR